MIQGRRDQGTYNKQFTLYTKISLKLITDLKVNPKTVKLLEENIGENLYELGLSFL